MAKRHYNSTSGTYAGDDVAGRRTAEMQEAGMIHEDRSKIANLPHEVMYKEYPYTYKYVPEDLDDTIAGVDKQIASGDDAKRNGGMKPRKV